jgi:hypothetical protein
VVYIPQQPLIERLQYEPPHLCDWPGCPDVSVNTLYTDQTPMAGRLTRYCRVHTQIALPVFRDQSQL